MVERRLEGATIQEVAVDSFLIHVGKMGEEIDNAALRSALLYWHDLEYEFLIR